MKTLEKRCLRTLIGPGKYAYDAELVIEEEEGRVSFLHANYNNGQHFTVGDGSIFEYMTQLSGEDLPEVQFSEVYDSLEAALASNYYQYFSDMDQMVKGMIQENQRLIDSMRLTKN